MDTEVTELDATALFWQTMSRAFLPPMGQAVADAFVTDLPDELEELAHVLGLAASQEVAALRMQSSCFTEPGALLLEYARLFLPPAGPVTLNLSRYVDRGVDGLCMDALEAAYLSEGLAPGNGLRDLADHASRQFEFMAVLAERLPGAEDRFAQHCLVGALPRLAAQLDRADAASPYTVLARLAAQAVRDGHCRVAAAPEPAS